MAEQQEGIFDMICNVGGTYLGGYVGSSLGPLGTTAGSMYGGKICKFAGKKAVVVLDKAIKISAKQETEEWKFLLGGKDPKDATYAELIDAARIKNTFDTPY
jgi:hypothetical protein